MQRLPARTAERLPASYQRALRWLAWLGFLGLAIANSGQASFGGPELAALAVAIGVSIWCVARPLGPPKLDLTDARHVLGEFAARTNWALLLIGAFLVVGGVAACGAIAYDLSTGRADIGDVLRDIGVFIEGWTVEVFTKGFYDAGLEQTHAYALFLLLVPGIPLLLVSLRPLVRRGRRFRVHEDGALDVLAGDAWQRVDERVFPSVVADGSLVRFDPVDGPALRIEQGRAFSTTYGVRLPAATLAAYLRERLAQREFTVEEDSAERFTARRT